MMRLSNQYQHQQMKLISHYILALGSSTKTICFQLKIFPNIMLWKVMMFNFSSYIGCGKKHFKN